MIQINNNDGVRYWRTDPAGLRFPVPADAFINDYSTLFNGVDEIVTGPPSDDVVGVTPTAITLSAWIKTTATSSQYIQSIKRQNASASSLFSVRVSGSNQLGLILRTGTGGGSATVTPTMSVSGGLTDGLWHYVCAGWDGSGWQAFVDGVSVGTGSELLEANSDTVHPYTVGGFEAGWGSLFFDGRIDEAAVFTGATKFTLAEAQEAYNSGSPTDLTDHTRAADLTTWWRMGDGDTAPVINDQVGTNDGTMVNMDASNFVLDVPSYTQRSLALDGVNEYVNCGNPVALQRAAPFTVSSWIKAPGAVGSFATPIAKSDGATDGWTVQMRDGDSEWRFWVNFGANLLGNGNNGGWYYSAIAESWADNDWHHVVGVWDGSIPILYVDNVAGTNPTAPSGESSLPNISADTTNPFTIGAESGFGNPAAVRICNVQFYDAALDAAAVEAIYNNGRPDDETGRANAVSQWRCGDDPADDATGGTGNIEDVVGVNNGTPTNTEPADIVQDAP